MVGCGSCDADSDASTVSSLPYVAPCLFEWSADVLANRVQQVEQALVKQLCLIGVCTTCDAQDLALNVEAQCPIALRAG